MDFNDFRNGNGQFFIFNRFDFNWDEGLRKENLAIQTRSARCVTKTGVGDEIRSFPREDGVIVMAVHQ